MLNLAIRQLRTHFRRSLAVIVAIVLGVAFFSASMMSGSVIREAIRGEVGNQLRGTDLLAVSENGSVDPDIATIAKGVEGVEATELVLNDYGSATVGGASTVLRLGTVSQLPELAGQMPLKEGRLPEAENEIALTEGGAKSAGATVGDIIYWSPFAMEPQEPVPFTVVGIVSGGNAFGTNITEAFILPETFHDLVTDPVSSAVVIQVMDDASIREVQDRLASKAPAGVEILTFDQVVDAEVASMEQGTNALTYGLVAFALIALFVAGIVISNTFSITLTQRTHELAMLRCIGAEKRQIHRSVIVEALILGVVSSLLGLVLGYGVVNAGARAFVEGAGGLSLGGISLGVLLTPLILGTIITLISAAVPARNATRVHPLQALRQNDAPIERASGGVVRIVLSGFLTVFGCILLLGGVYWSLSMEYEAPTGPLLIGMVGGAISFVGLLIASFILVPLGIRVAGRLVEAVLGTPARIATSNSMRNPRRTAATSSALMMGVALIAMMTVGAATVQATWNDVIDQQAPIDLYVQGSRDTPAEPLPGAILNGFPDVDGVKSVTPIHAQDAHLLLGGTDFEISAVGIDPDEARAASRSQDVFRDFSNGDVLVPVDLAKSYGLEDGDVVTLSRETRSIEFVVKTVTLFDWEVYVTLDDAKELSADLPVTGAWIRLDDDASVQTVIREISDGIPAGESVAIHGGASDRATYLSLVDQLLLITTALLGVAVIIAIVGVGNTLTLSVLERTRESGMLRAMGLTAGQLRETLAIEGVLIAFVGGLIGLAAGAVYGWIGAMTLFGSSWDVVPGFPVGRMLLILVVAILAGMLASVLPGRRAASISPVEALATV
ncbi:MAG TPA: FtsX-like permease family protein [Thermomicrobiales bacterium]|nr:FtsX-like permease family protein [Thermomicrobiales bacterium]